jgi:nudix-type nucleoside diphosphatase (YffH/AdpP family)
MAPSIHAQKPEAMPEILKRKLLHEGWNRFWLVTVRLDNGDRIERIVEDHGAVAAVLPYNPERKCATLVRQFRAPAFIADERADLQEAVAGVVEDGDPAECGKREAMEETGLELHNLEYVASPWSTPGLSTERMHLYLATYGEADRVGTGGGLDEEHENITVEEVPLAVLAGMADRGEIDDLKTFTLVQTLRLRRPELFELP